MKRIILVILLICKISDTHSLSCSEILELPSDKKWTVTELQTIPPKEIVECLAHLGKEQLPAEVADYIWKTIINFYDGKIENIPDSVLMILHWVTPAVKPEDYSNITLDNIDVIENFGLNYKLDFEQLEAIANRVREDFAGKEPEDYTYYDLVALKQILCHFNRSEIERIHPSAYREAALMVGKLEDCEAEAMLGFASLAVNPSGFGSPDKWNEGTIKTMGIVAEYLPRDIIARFKVGVSSVKGNSSM